MSAVIATPQRIVLPSVITRWRVDGIRPNRHNGELFPDSLSPGSIAPLADDLRENGQEQPILIRPDGIIVNGERRWRGAQLLGWDEMNVVVSAPLTDDETLDRILGNCGASRQMTLREKVNVYSAFLDRLKLNSGRPRGRPGAKTIPSGNVFQSPKAIKQAAAARAKFDSPTEAERALAVFTRGNLDLQRTVAAGEMTLTAAYNELPKRPKAKKVLGGNEAPDSRKGIGVPPTDGAPAPAAEGENGEAPLEEVASVEAGPPEGKGDIDMSLDEGSTDTVAATAPAAAVDVKDSSDDDDDESLERAIHTMPQESDPRKGLGGAKGLSPSPTSLPFNSYW